MSQKIRNIDAVLVVLDISGYTRFIHQRVVSLEHAESIITDLMEAIIDCADFPLHVNKLEGDAALLYAEIGSDTAAAVRSVSAQIVAFFDTFREKLGAIRVARSHCGCNACANVDALRLKAIVHVGPIVVKQVRQFEEIAGDAVILLHRLMKNDVPSDEYVLFTDAAHAQLENAGLDWSELLQSVEGMGSVAVRWCGIETLRGCAGLPITAPAPALPALAQPVLAPSVQAQPVPEPQRSSQFRHLPSSQLENFLRVIFRLTMFWRR